MENNNKMNTCGCDCNGCKCAHGYKDGHHWMWKKIMWIVIILFVFCFGVKYGELKSYSYMMRGGGYGMMNWGAKDGNKFYRMMPWTYDQQETNTDNTTAPKTQ